MAGSVSPCDPPQSKFGYFVGSVVAGRVAEPDEQPRQYRVDRYGDGASRHGSNGRLQTDSAEY